MKRMLLHAAVLMMALLLVCVGFTACGNNPADSTTDPTTAGTTVTLPTRNLVDATGSTLLGEWDVVCEKGRITHLKFDANGAAIVTTENGALGGSFVHNGDELQLTVSSTTMVGTVTVDGNTAVFKTETDTLTMTKVN